MAIAKWIGNVTIVILACAGAFASALCLWVNVWGGSIVPYELTATYVTVKDPETNEDIPTLKANYYANKSGKGYSVMEFRIDGYSGPSGQYLYPRGFQMVWDADGNIVPYINETTGAKSDVWYYDYDKTSDHSFITGHEFKMTTLKKDGSIDKLGDPFFMDLKKGDKRETVAVVLDGTYDLPAYKPNWKFYLSYCTFGISLLFDHGVFDEYQTHHAYTFSNLLIKMRDIIVSCSAGTGDYTINMVDLGDFLHLYEVDENNNIKIDSRIGGEYTNSFFSVEAHYDTRGMQWTKQSLFGSVAGDSGYNITGIDEDVEYWQATSTYRLTEQDFEARYSAAEQGYYYALPTATINRFSQIEDLEIDIDFNLSAFDVKVLGFDFYALAGLPLRSISITSSHYCDFRLQVGSLKDTGLTAANIKKSGINLIDLSGEVAA